MVVLVVCYYTHEFWSYVLPKIKDSNQTIEAMTDSEVRTPAKRYWKVSTGSEIRNAARMYEQIEIVRLPCAHLLGDRYLIEREIQALEAGKCKKYLC